MKPIQDCCFTNKRNAFRGAFARLGTAVKRMRGVFLDTRRR